ncbi:four helix bundle protein [Flavobacterium sp. ANB]|uniref:four helix bundle protein n=1 Tax=unclassified Flavobacterium TaxID=196869 RepID=UPI0012B91B0E|nr:MULTISPECIES: four helix bundle protein [unclassified Flavobacterium]MBF4518629.1 four helix bundle protein [Flavobacterium sp. ANB]MTD67865.1 four helix bundle protein [Flavobacterium sp. LC2016-13]
MTTEEMKLRTKKFSLMIIDLAESMPNTNVIRSITNQIVRSGTSVGANYRAVCRARSDREFVAKMNIVLEEADETLFWLEIIKEKMWIAKSELELIWKEGNELTAIFVSSLKTVNNRINK